jgi:glycosyltransferase involved in cell wall biosynthesis
MKKVLFFVESLTVGGAEKSLLSLLNNFDYDRYEVHLMMIKRGGDFEQFVPSNLTIEYLEIDISFISRVKFKVARLINFNKYYHLAQLFWKSIQSDVPFIDHKYDVSIAWGQGFATYFVAERVTSIKKFAWVNIDYEKAGYKWEKDSAIYNKFDKVIGVSDFVKDIMQKYLPEQKVTSIINIIDRDDIEIKAKSPVTFYFDKNKVNILSVGRLTKQKGFELAIEATKILINNGVPAHLYIIGEGIERISLQQIILSNNLTNHITLLGLIDNPYPFMKNCDIYLQTSRFEGLGRTVFEASILNKPIVCTDFPTSYSILENNVTGLIVPMEPGQIAYALESLINDNQLTSKLIKNLENRKNSSKQKTLDDIKALLDS